MVAEKHWSEVYFLPEGQSAMTKKQNREMYNEVYKPLLDYAKEVRRSNKRLMRVIKRIKSPSFYRGLSAYLRELKDNCYGSENMKYKITRTPRGKYQTENGCGRELKGVWCEQWSVGMDGDSYEGFVSIKLRENRFLTVNFSM